MDSGKDSFTKHLAHEAKSVEQRSFWGNTSIDFLCGSYD
jgi:hypothetical protein